MSFHCLPGIPRQKQRPAAPESRLLCVLTSEPEMGTLAFQRNHPQRLGARWFQSPHPRLVFSRCKRRTAVEE